MKGLICIVSAEHSTLTSFNHSCPGPDGRSWLDVYYIRFLLIISKPAGDCDKRIKYLRPINNRAGL